MWFREAVVLIETQNISKSIIFFKKLQKKHVFEVPLFNAKPFLSQSATTDSAAFTNKSTYIWWSSLYNKKWKNLSNSSKFLLHILERLRENISSAMGQKWRSKLTKKILAKKKIGDTLVDRMIPIYKCAPPPPPPSTPSSKNFQKKKKN